ncbi:MAG TPA: acyl-CoA dehydrogenase family protein [Solirubrobacteraceae bacterium]|jgi:alkylation response protein AidB-like acyl-CoA dehydrogenase
MLSPAADFTLGLTDAHEQLRARVHDLAEEHIVPILVESDSDERYPLEVFQAFGREGLLGGTLPPEYGGAGMDNVTLTVMCEELGRYSQPIAGLIGAASTVFGTPLMRFGTEEQKQRYLVPYVRGERTGALALTEARSGSDAAGMTTAARKVDGGWVIDGQKAWIDGTGVADWFMVFAQTDPTQGTRGISAFVIERDVPGFQRTVYRNKHGWRPSPVGQLDFTNCFVTDDALVGEVGRGYRVALASVGYGRLQVAARHCGGLRACLDESVAWAKERHLYGHPIAELQLIQTKIVDMSLALDTGRYLTYRFARLLDDGAMARREGSMAKVYTAEMLMRSAHDAVQIQGARAIGEESLVGRLFRDAKVSEIVEGANEVQRTLIAEYELGIRDA